MIKQYVLEFGSGILPRSIPFAITSREKEYFISPAGNQVISVCNHKETDTGLVLHASKVDSDVAVVCKDADVLKIIIWAYSKLNITNNWYLTYVSNIVFEFSKNTRLNRMRYNILLLMSNENYTLFFISNTFISNARLKLAENQASAKQHPEAELLLLENYSHSSSTLSPKNNRTYSKK